MSRYIDAEKLQALFLKRYDELLNLIEAGNKTIDIPSFIGKLINDAPTADVKEVVRGKIVTNVYERYVIHQKCSICNEELEYKSYPNFCSNCGADMRGERNDLWRSRK